MCGLEFRYSMTNFKFNNKGSFFMLSLQHFTRLIVISSCLFAAGVSCTQADEEKKSPATSPTPAPTDMNVMMYPMMGQMSGMMNPHMYMNMMNPMMGMMNPQMMNPMMMMGGGMMNPMMGMNMMYPMMGMMGPMKGPMSGGVSMPGMDASGSNPMTQMPGAQMMDPKQYEQWYKQWTKMMKNLPAQTPPSQANK